MRKIYALSEERFHINEISPVNAQMVKLSCVKRKFV